MILNIKYFSFLLKCRICVYIVYIAVLEKFMASIYVIILIHIVVVNVIAIITWKKLIVTYATNKLNTKIKLFMYLFTQIIYFLHIFSYVVMNANANAIKNIHVVSANIFKKISL